MKSARARARRHNDAGLQAGGNAREKFRARMTRDVLSAGFRKKIDHPGACGLI